MAAGNTKENLDCLFLSKHKIQMTARHKQHIKCKKASKQNTHRNVNMEPRKLVLNVITARFPANVDLLVQKPSICPYVRLLKTGNT